MRDDRWMRNPAHPHHRSMRAARRLALVSVAACALFASATVDLAHADDSTIPPSATADTAGRTAPDHSAALAALVARTETDNSAAHARAIEAIEAIRHTESILGVADATGDAPFPQADLVSVGANSDQQGITAMVAMVATYESPFSASWQFRDTALLWGFDTDGDGDEDAAAVMVNFGGLLAGGVLDATDKLLCDAVPFWDPARRAYGLAFPTDCLGSPSSYRFYASFAYQDYTTAISSIDEAPDTTWSLPVTNDEAPEVGSSTTFFTACQAASVPQPASADIAFQAIDPVRVLDTRSGMSTIDCLANGVGAIEGGDELRLPVAGRGGIAGGARAVALNVTVTGAKGPGYLTVYPCGQTRPLASNVNFTAGATVANAVVVKVGTNGEVCLYSSAHVDVVVDANGWFGAPSNFWATMPTRLLDSRAGGAPRRASGSITQINVGTPAGTSAPVTSVMLNVTVTDPAAAGFVTVFPCGTPTPLASNLNYVAGATVANAVVATVGVGGTVCLYTSAEAHLVTDLGGWFTGTTDFLPLDPARLLDTRPSGTSDLDGTADTSSPAAGAITRLVVAGRGGVPASATAVVLNVTVTGTQGAGYLTVFPCGTTPPNASNVNFVAGDTRANAVVAKVGEGGAVCFVSNVGTHLVVDVNGYHT
jgi:hypothetical protein